MSVNLKFIGAVMSFGALFATGCRTSGTDADLAATGATPSTGHPGACYHESFRACIESTTMDISSSCVVDGSVFLKKCPDKPRMGTCVVTTKDGTKFTRIYKDAAGFPNAERDCIHDQKGRWIPN